MADLDQEIAAYQEMRDSLEAKHTGKGDQFGSGPYLIRQVGAPPVTLPASVVYNLAYG
jgi:hypothetical protein